MRSKNGRRILVTGGAGFIGSCFVRRLALSGAAEVVVLDSLTYAGNLMNLAGLPMGSFRFVHGSILDSPLVKRVLLENKIDAVVHFAAESHVDRSIEAPKVFLDTNVIGTQVLLDGCRAVWRDRASECCFIHVSTDEVYGELGPTGKFTEETPYSPRSPYSASKAASDHLVMAYHHTYGFPAIITNCSNNYGPYQFPEKLIPLMIRNSLLRKPLPVYGKGENIRDWLYVEDHCAAIELILDKGRIGERYNIGGDADKRNIDLVRALCDEVARQRGDGFDYQSLISFVTDRPGHDFRYAIDHSKLTRELGWKPTVDFRSGLARTISWYLANSAWLDAIEDGSYRSFRLEAA